MYKIFYLFLSILLFNACKNNNQTAREPIQHKQGGADMKSVQLNKELNQKEENYILQMIKKDSLHTYHNSGHGFWYYYIDKKDDKAKRVQSEDLLSLNYEIKDLSDNIIYSKDEIGNVKYHVDHENYFRGFHDAVKLLKEGEKAVFIFPSNSAYGYHGDEKKIGQNIPLKVMIKINKIEKSKK